MLLAARLIYTYFTKPLMTVYSSDMAPDAKTLNGGYTFRLANAKADMEIL
jgi:hypothetical protein